MRGGCSGKNDLTRGPTVEQKENGTVRGPLRRVLVRGPSMAPTLADGDVLLVRPAKQPHVGDVVVVGWAARPGQLSVKRAVRPESGGWHVLGDFPDASTDSRTLGPARVQAVVLVRVWPRPGRLGARGPLP